MNLVLAAVLGLIILTVTALPVVLAARAGHRPGPETYLEPQVVEGRLKRKFTAGPPMRALIDPERFVRIDAPGVPPFRDLPYVGDERGYNGLSVGARAGFVLARHPRTGALCVVGVRPMD